MSHIDALAWLHHTSRSRVVRDAVNYYLMGHPLSRGDKASYKRASVRQ